jgi:hypothetical protein
MMMMLRNGTHAKYISIASTTVGSRSRSRSSGYFALDLFLFETQYTLSYTL